MKLRLLFVFFLLANAAFAYELAGFLPVSNPHTSQIFFHFVSSQTADSDTPILLWLQGGPGVSSLLGEFLEIGPERFQLDGTFRTNPVSWNQRYHLLFVDQPVGSGFSYTNDKNAFPQSTAQAADVMWLALQQFFHQYPEFKNNPFFITGESYGGKYIPALAQRILEGNQAVLEHTPFPLASYAPQANDSVVVHLKGLAIGDGWMHPVLQNKAYVDAPYAVGLYDLREKKLAQEIYEDLVKAIEAENWVYANVLSNKIQKFMADSAGSDEDDFLNAKSAIDAYLPALTEYLNSPAAKTRFNVGNHSWAFYNATTEDAFNSDQQRSILPIFRELLPQIPILLYCGNLDMNCGCLSLDYTLNALAESWPEAAYLLGRKKVFYHVDGALSGYYKEYLNLRVLVVRNAGHELPYYQGKIAFDMIERFVEGKPFS
eukprot:GCRY01002883.1.p1 GENE.GCRY01002883.1~~GCRY01002883.1.p1  ORF type:complete len:430 (-),score=61.35 GCRY01002883.1:73-1362(-)